MAKALVPTPNTGGQHWERFHVLWRVDCLIVHGLWYYYVCSREYVIHGSKIHVESCKSLLTLELSVKQLRCLYLPWADLLLSESNSTNFHTVDLVIVSRLDFREFLIRELSISMIGSAHNNNYRGILKFAKSKTSKFHTKYITLELRARA